MVISMKEIDRKKQGKRNRASGLRFERIVKDDLISKGLFVSKFQSTVDFNFENKLDKEIKKNVWKDYIEGKKVPYVLGLQSAKGNRFRARTLGFPDFIVWGIITKNDYTYIKNGPLFDVIGVEAKSDGYLDRIEKAKCKWLLENQIFSSILIAKKIKVGRKIVPKYIEFEVK